MPHMPDFEAWAIFAKVADRGSFAQAAEDLGIAKTTVSKAVTRLEERLRTTLLHRTTRKLSLTESGRLALDRARRILADGATIEADILDEAAVPRGLIRLAVTTAFGVVVLSPILPAFLKAYPDIQIDLCLIDNPVDVVMDGFDFVLQIGAASDSSLRISRLLSFRRILVASPDFIAIHGLPEHPRDLEHMPAVVPTHVAWGSQWKLDRAGESCTIQVQGALRINNASAMVPALVAGLGMTLMPEYFVWQEVADGRLVELLPDWSALPGPLYVVSPPGRARPARVRVLLDFLRQHFAAHASGYAING
jgi:DNA-binding transcriptional LysR family regulator